MNMWRRWLVVACLGGCGTGVATGTEDADIELGEQVSEGADTAIPQGACGETSFIALDVSGRVVDDAGRAVHDVSVWVEQRHWGPTVVHGTGTTDTEGRYQFEASEMPIVDGCWGTGPQFFGVASDGTQRTELEINYALVTAWLGGTERVDLSDLLVFE